MCACVGFACVFEQRESQVVMVVTWTYQVCNMDDLIFCRRHEVGLQAGNHLHEFTENFKLLPLSGTYH